ncbi:MAG: dihydrodipicolinate synthase family protein, partial [Anaerococcus sp.]|nr:dihydrodipicolinate synthase family protein [Anaerococcus sp.]
KNPRVIGVKNSSMPVQDIQMFKQDAGEDYIIFNGPDEQFISGRLIGAEGAIGGTYGAMPDLFLKMNEHLVNGNLDEACNMQYDINAIIYKMVSGHGNMYAVIKAILRENEDLDIGSVRKPLAELNDEDLKYLNKVVSVSKFYYFDDNILKISLTKDQLINEYGFTEKDYQTLSETVLNKEVNLDEKDNKPVATPYASVSNGTLYISHSDLQGGAFAVLSAASSAGPAAMYSALLSISTALSGPVGSIITTIVSLLAAPSLTELCVRVTYAIATNQGIYIKPVASYPPLDIGYY